MEVEMKKNWSLMLDARSFQVIRLRLTTNLKTVRCCCSGATETGTSCIRFPATDG